MKRISFLAFALLLASGVLFTANAAPIGATAPAVETNLVEAQRRCHHYRWTSRSHCTSAQALQYYLPPRRLHYPRQYFGGTPHYAYARPYYYGYRGPYFGPYGFYRYRLHPGYYWY